MGEASRRTKAKQPVKELKLIERKSRRNVGGYAQSLMNHLTTTDKNFVTGRPNQNAINAVWIDEAAKYAEPEVAAIMEDLATKRNTVVITDPNGSTLTISEIPEEFIDCPSCNGTGGECLNQFHCEPCAACDGSGKIRAGTYIKESGNDD